MSVTESKCPNKASKEWKMLVSQTGEDLAWTTWMAYSGEYPDMKPISTLREEIGIRSNISSAQIPLMAKRVREYNKAHGTAHSFTPVRVGEADLYVILFNVNYLPVNEEKKRQKEYTGKDTFVDFDRKDVYGVESEEGKDFWMGDEALKEQEERSRYYLNRIENAPTAVQQQFAKDLRAYKYSNNIPLDVQMNVTAHLSGIVLDTLNTRLLGKTPIKVFVPGKDGKKYLFVRDILGKKLAELITKSRVSPLSEVEESYAKLLRHILGDDGGNVYRLFEKAIIRKLNEKGYKLTSKGEEIIFQMKEDGVAPYEEMLELEAENQNDFDLTEDQTGKNDVLKDSLTISNKETMSTNLRTFLSAIRSNQPSAIPLQSIDGGRIFDVNYVNEDIVIQALNEATLGDTSFAEMIASLRAVARTIPERYYLNAVADKLIEASEEIKNQFVTKFNQQQATFIVHRFDKAPRILRRFVNNDGVVKSVFAVSEDGKVIFEYNPKIFDSNRNELANNLRTKAKEDFYYQNGLDTEIVPKAVKDTVYAKYTAFKNSVDQYLDDQGDVKDAVGLKSALKDLLTSISIELSDPALNRFISGVLPGNKRINFVTDTRNYSSVFNERFGVLHTIFSEFTKEEPDIDSVYGTSGARTFFNIESLYQQSYYNTSVLNGKGQKVWGYSAPNPLSTEFYKISKELESNSPEHITRILQDPYRSKSFLLETFLALNAEQRRQFLENFKYGIVNTLKSGTRDGKDLNNTEKREFILTQLLALSSNAVVDGSGNTWSFKFLTTPSDKSVMYQLQTPDFKLEVVKGKPIVGEATVNRFYEYFKGEYDRAMAYQKAAPEQKAIYDSIENFEPMLFYHFPILNIRKDNPLWAGGKLAELSDDLENYIKTRIQVQIIADIANTQKNWESLGLWKNGKLEMPFGKSYRAKVGDKISLMSAIREVEKNEVGLSYEELKSDMMATYEASDKNMSEYMLHEYAINYHLHNIEMQMLFLGDPADFLKNSKAKLSNNPSTVASDNMDVWKAYIDGIRDNLSKRMAGVQAAGMVGNHQKNETSNTVVLVDNSVTSKVIAEYRTALGQDAKKFESIDHMDGQEIITAEEDLLMKLQFGKISRSQYQSISAKVRGAHQDIKETGKISPEHLFTDAESFIAQAQKPVMFAMVPLQISPAVTKFKTTYYKSSAFGLYPQFTQGLEIDKLREAAYELGLQGNRVDRFITKSASKLGIKSPIKGVFNQAASGRVSLDINPLLAITPDNIDLVPRENLRIQLEVPYDPEKDKIRIASQQVKLIFNEILDIDFDSHNVSVFLPELGKEVSGQELKDLHDKTYKELLNLSKDEVLEQIGASYDESSDEFHFANLEKLQQVLFKQAVEQGYDMPSLEGLELTEDKQSFKIPLSFSNNADRYEKLLLSMVKKIILQKIHGRSFILATETGFVPKLADKIAEGKEGLEAAEKEAAEQGEQIIFSDKFNREVGLLPARPNPENPHEVLPAQVLISFKFKDNKGNKLKLSDFTKTENGRTLIDTSKFDHEVLRMLGIRIPVQGHPSMASIEIVGFIPEFMGDLIIAPQDFTKQFGSDFDIDKLYAYTYNYIQNKEGKLIRATAKKKRAGEKDLDSYEGNFTDLLELIEDQDTPTKKSLQNKLMDIYHVIMLNKQVWAKSMQGITEGRLTQLSDSIRDLRLRGQSNEFFSPSSEQNKVDEYFENKAGKTGVGIYSVNNTFATVIEGRGIKLAKFEADDKGTPRKVENPLVIVDNNGKATNFAELSGAKGFNRIISAYQSGAVDNAKLKILDFINSNSHTMGVSAVMAMLADDSITHNVLDEKTGAMVEMPVVNEDFIVYFLGQPSVVEYINKLAMGNDAISGYDAEHETTKMYEVLNAIQAKGEELAGPDFIRQVETFQGFNQNELKKHIFLADDKSVDYLINQYAVLDKFREFKETADDVRSLQYLLNADSNGTPGSLDEGLYKRRRMEQILETPPGSNTPTGVSTLMHAERAFLNDNGTTTLQGEQAMMGIYLPIKLFGETGIFTSGSVTTEHMIKTIYEINGKNPETYSYKFGRKVDKAVLSYLQADKRFQVQGENETIYGEKTALLYGTKETGSLGDDIEAFKRTDEYKNNNLLKPLFESLKIRLQDEAKFVEFQAFTGLINPVEEIIQSLEYLRNNNYPLFEKLVKYTLLIQYKNSPISLRQFIAPYYLQGVGIAERYRHIATEINTSVLDNLLTKPSAYMTIPRFVEQFLQHNPEEAMQVDEAHITFLNSDYSESEDISNAFSLDASVNNQYKFFKTAREGMSITTVATPYLSLYDNKEDKWKLYKVSDLKVPNAPHKVIYTEIPILGQYNLEEYDYDSEGIIASVLSGNNPVIFTQAKPGVITPTETIELVSEPMDLSMPAEANIFGRNTSTIDEIISGTRTSTTRGYWHNLVKGKVKSVSDLVGKQVTFRNKEGKSVDVVITDVHRISKEDRKDPVFLDQWSKSEGWTQEHLLAHTKVGEYQVKFRLISIQTGGIVDLSKANISQAQKSHLAKDQYKSDKANKIIARGNGATGEYARLWKEAGKPVNGTVYESNGDMVTGPYTNKDVVFISANGKRAGRTAPDLQEVLRAANSGATFLTDGRQRRPEGGNEYNTGEQEVADFLRKLGYTEVEEFNGLVARWTKPVVGTQVFPGNDTTTPQGVSAVGPVMDNSLGKLGDALKQFFDIDINDDIIRTGEATIKSILNIVASDRNLDNPYFKELARLLAEVHKKTGFLKDIEFRISSDPTEGNFYDSDKHEVVIQSTLSPEEIPYTVMHEVIHAASVGNLKNGEAGIQLQTRINRLINHLDSDVNLLKAIDYYGLEGKQGVTIGGEVVPITVDYLRAKLGQLRAGENVTYSSKEERQLLNPLINYNEFVAMTLGDRKVQDFFNTVDYQDYPGDKVQSVWGRLREVFNLFIEKLARMFNIEITDKTVLKEALNLALESLEGTPNTNTYLWYGKMYDIVLDDLGKAMDIIGYKGKNADKQKILEAYNKNPNLDVQSGKPFRNSPTEKPTEKVGNTFTHDAVTIDTGFIKLNEGQEQALRLAIDAVVRRQTSFTIRGFAGTGKSTSIALLVKYLKAKYPSAPDMRVAAPTHKAVKVLKAFFIKNKEYGAAEFTVAKILGLQKKDGKFIPGAYNKMPSRGLLIVDEASMIDRTTYSQLMDLAKSKGTTIIFMGDPAQIPPVGEPVVSPALIFKNESEGIQLSEIMRQKAGNPLIKVLTGIRENLLSKADTFEHRGELNDKGEGINFTGQQAAFETKLKAAFASPEFARDKTHAKVVTYTNSSVFNYNQMVRDYILQDARVQYQRGEILMGYEQTGAENTQVHNGQDYEILESTYSSKTLNVPVSESVDGRINVRNVQIKVDGFKVKLREIYDPETTQILRDYYKSELKWSDNDIDKFFTKETFIINPTSDGNAQLYEELYKWKEFLKNSRIEWRFRQEPQKEYDRFIADNQMPDQLIKFPGQPVTTLTKLKTDRPELFKRQPDGTIPLDKLKYQQFEKNIDYGYAITAHKSQGSTYATVFVDVDNLHNPANMKLINENGKDFSYERNNLMYVALSRSSSRVEAFSRDAKPAIHKLVGISPFQGQPNTPQDTVIPETLSRDYFQTLKESFYKEIAVINKAQKDGKITQAERDTKVQQIGYKIQRVEDVLDNVALNGFNLVDFYNNATKDLFEANRLLNSSPTLSIEEYIQVATSIKYYETLYTRVLNDYNSDEVYVTQELMNKIAAYHRKAGLMTDRLSEMALKAYIKEYSTQTGFRRDEDDFYRTLSSNFARNQFITLVQSKNQLAKSIGRVVADMVSKTESSLKEHEEEDTKEANKFLENFSFEDITEEETYRDQFGIEKTEKNFISRYKGSYFRAINDIFRNAESIIDPKNKSTYIRTSLNNVAHTIDLRYLYPTEYNEEMKFYLDTGNEKLETDSRDTYQAYLESLYLAQFDDLDPDYVKDRVNTIIDQAKDRMDTYTQAKDAYENYISSLALTAQEKKDLMLDWLSYNSPFVVLNERFGLEQTKGSILNAPFFETAKETKLTTYISKKTGQTMTGRKFVNQKLRKDKAETYIIKKANRKSAGKKTDYYNDRYLKMEEGQFLRDKEKAALVAAGNQAAADELSKVPTMLEFLQWTINRQKYYLSAVPSYLKKELRYSSLLDVEHSVRDVIEQKKNNLVKLFTPSYDMFDNFLDKLKSFWILPQLTALAWDSVVRTVSERHKDFDLKRIDFIRNDARKNFNPGKLSNTLNNQGLGNLKTTSLKAYLEALRTISVTFKTKNESESMIRLGEFLFDKTEQTDRASNFKLEKTESNLVKWTVDNKLYGSDRISNYGTWTDSKSKMFGLINPIWKLTKQERDKYREISQRINYLAELRKTPGLSVQEIRQIDFEVESLNKSLDNLKRVANTKTAHDAFAQFIRLGAIGYAVFGRYTDFLASTIMGGIREATDGRLFDFGDYSKALSKVMTLYMPKAAASTTAVIGGVSLNPVLLGVGIAGRIGAGVVNQTLRNSEHRKLTELMKKLGALDFYHTVSDDEIVSNTVKKNIADEVTDVAKLLKPYQLTQEIEQINKSVPTLAVLYHTKVKDKAGNDRTLYDAFTVSDAGELVWNDAEFDPQKDMGFDFVEGEKMRAVKANIRTASTNINGDYTREHTLLGDATIRGRAVMLLRRYMAQWLQARISDTYVDDNTNLQYMGSMYSLYHQATNLLKEGKIDKSDYVLIANKQALAGTAMTLGILLAAVAVIGAASGGDDDDYEVSALDNILFFVNNILMRSFQDNTILVDPSIIRKRSLTGIHPYLSFMYNAMSAGSAAGKYIEGDDLMNHQELTQNGLSTILFKIPTGVDKRTGKLRYKTIRDYPEVSRLKYRLSKVSPVINQAVNLPKRFKPMKQNNTSKVLEQWLEGGD